MLRCLYIFFISTFFVGMFGKDEFEEAKIGAVCLTMEDLVRMPFDFAFDVEGAEEKVYSKYAFRFYYS